MLDPERDLARRAIAALLWIAAFSFAVGIFLVATLLIRDLPPTAPIAVGRVTIEQVSKLRDYVSALLFFLIVPAATIWLYRVGERENERLRNAVAWRARSADVSGLQNLISLLFVTPFFLAPFLYLTTFKWGWPVCIPIMLSELMPRIVIVFTGTRWLRRLLARPMLATHSLLLTEGLAWLIFRYVATGKRIAHIPTLFLELVFIVFFLLVFWCAFLLIARIASFVLDVELETALQRVSIGVLPLVILPPLVIAFVQGTTAILLIMSMVVIAIGLMLRGRTPIDSRTVRNLVAFAILPMLLYCVSYASTSGLNEWIDLFHRGEAIGPASDYLRGKVPYRDVFVLHGLLEDGLLDTWLMQLFGRDISVALARPVVLGAFAVPALWYLAMALFDSIPLSLLVILLGAVTTTDNERALFEIAALALLLAGVRRARPWLIAFSGVVAGLALFFSFDIGIYSIGGALLFLAVLRRWRSLSVFVAGVAIGCAPFVIYLAIRGAFGAFLETSFITLPRIIDAVWSVPFPDLTTAFHHDLNLHTISDFVLYDSFRFVLNPLVIGIALLVLVQRFLSGKSDRLRNPADVALLALTMFALITQRSALGRADFPHQYFSAFLIGPMIVILFVFAAEGMATLWRRGDHGVQAFLALLLLTMLPLFAITLWVPDIVNSRLDDTIRYLPRVTRIGFKDPQTDEIKNRIDSVRYQVAELSKAGEPIFDFSNQPSFYFYCNRPNPTRFYQVPIMSPREFQAETINALEHARPPLVIRRSPQQFDVFDGVDNSIRAQAVSAYIDDHYEYARSTRGVEIWTRRRDHPMRLDMNAYLRQIRVPTLKELNAVGSRTRLVFPSVGSLAGIGDSYWRTDLVLHNPFKEPMALGLRYVSADAKIDRHLILGGGQSIRWEDVVRSFFQAPGGRGTLWIDYRGDHGPVARAKTYDIAHAGKGSLDSPLSMRDSATAGWENSDLTIVGIPSGTLGRRVNLGVINVGDIPATFRISVHTRAGAQIGRTISQGLPEDESFQLGDAERILGVPMDESITLHVTMIAGTGIAYAAIADPSGENELIAAVPSPR